MCIITNIYSEMIVIRCSFVMQSVLYGVLLYGYLGGVLTCDPVKGCNPFAPSSTLQRIASILCDVQIIIHFVYF